MRRWAVLWGTVLSAVLRAVSLAACGGGGSDSATAPGPDQPPTVAFIYVYYTTVSGGTRNRVSRFTASATHADVAEPGSERVLVDLPALSSANNHNGGALHFGTDGKLYVGVGDNANSSNSPNPASPLGKLLRFNDDGSIPGDNPHAGTQTGLARAIWARGLRNPFTFAVQPGTGPLFTYKHNAAAVPGSGPGGFFVGSAIAGGTFYPAGGSLPAPCWC